MFRCDHCGELTGVTGPEHPDCTAVVAVVEHAIQVGETAALRRRVDEAAQQHGRPAAREKTLVSAWRRSLARVFEDGVVSLSDEDRLASAASQFQLDQDLLGEDWTRLVKGAVLREVLEGRVPDKVRIQGDLAPALHQGERIVWAFPNVEYLEQRTRRSYSGMSHGLSIRIAKGVYYRPSVFKVSPTERTEVVSVAKGVLFVTTKHLTFVSHAKSVRLPYRKLVTITPFSDGVGVHRDALSAKPQSFVTGDGWFTYNLITNLAQMAQ